MTFDDAVQTYLAARSQNNSDLSRDLYSLKRLSPHFSGFLIANLKRVHIRKYVSSRLEMGVKLSTVRRELRLFSAAINFVRQELDLFHLPNPVSCLGLKDSEPRVRWITQFEARALVNEADLLSRPHLAVFIRLALNTGCRRGELLNLEWSRVDLNRRLFLLESRHTKQRKRRTVPLNDDAIEALNDIASWQSCNVPGMDWVFGWERGKITTFKTSWKRILQTVGISDFRIHDLRHTFASWLVMQGESIYVVKELLGHASITQTEIYAHLAPSQAFSAVQRMLPF